MKTNLFLAALFALLFSLFHAATAAPNLPCTWGGNVHVKETTGTCETTYGVKSYAGYVKLPAGTLESYDQYIFFWFFEARQNPKTAPLTVWLQGGPGSGSTAQALGGNGPCRVKGNSKTTEKNQWSWNTHSNMLYIDHSIHSGFSYDSSVEGKLDLLGAGIIPDGGPLDPNGLYMDGTFSSQNFANGPKTTAELAATLWDFLQVWMSEHKFENYRRDSINLWTQSYGGHWGPEIVSHFREASNPSLKPRHCPRSGGCSPRGIEVSHLGILSGVIDFLVQGEHYPDFAVNNTYGIEAYSTQTAAGAQAAFYAPDGCKDLATACQDIALTMDPDNTGNVPDVQMACGIAYETCFFGVYAPYEAESGLNPFDIAQGRSVQFPEPYAFGYLNSEVIQKKLNVKISEGNGVNYTHAIMGPVFAFVQSGDYLRKDFRLKLGAILDAGVPVTLAYGDRDFRANWFGGEAVSKAIPFDGQDDFVDAGYADFSVAGSVAGKTRQAGLLSFTRIFQAGHEIPFYKARETHALFVRSLQNKDIPTGSQSASAANPNFATTGPADVRDITATPAGNMGSTFCYVLNPPLTNGQCSPTQLAGLGDGTAVVNNFIVA